MLLLNYLHLSLCWTKVSPYWLGNTHFNLVHNLHRLSCDNQMRMGVVLVQPLGVSLFPHRLAHGVSKHGVLPALHRHVHLLDPPLPAPQAHLQGEAEQAMLAP